jgi:hypothetical protein
MADHLGGGQAAGSPAAGGAGNPGDQGAQDSGIGQEQLAAFQEQLGKQSSENENLKQTIERMKSALTGEERGGNAEPEFDDAWYQDVLRVAFEAEKAGKGIPITVDIATRLRDSMQESTLLKKELLAMKAQMRQVSNPEVLHNQRVYENIDNTIHDTIEGLYGEVDPMFAEYVAGKISSEIKKMQATDKDSWNRLRASDSMQKQLVAGIVRQAVPKSIREKLKSDYLANSPMTEEELAAAYKQADQIQDPELRRKAKDLARQSYWEVKFGKNKAQSWAGRTR